MQWIWCWSMWLVHLSYVLFFSLLLFRFCRIDRGLAVVAGNMFNCVLVRRIRQILSRKDSAAEQVVFRDYGSRVWNCLVPTSLFGLLLHLIFCLILPPASFSCLCLVILSLYSSAPRFSLLTSVVVRLLVHSYFGLCWWLCLWSIVVSLSTPAGHLDIMVVSRTRDCSSLLELARLMVFKLRRDKDGQDAGTVVSHSFCGRRLWILICVGMRDSIRGGVTGSLTVLSYILRSSLNHLFLPPLSFCMPSPGLVSLLYQKSFHSLHRLPALKWICFRI